MTLKEAMAARHTVRRYTGQPIPANAVEALSERAARRNEEYGLAIQLVTDDPAVLGPVLRLVLARGVRDYLLLAGPDTPGADEALGYCGVELMLLAQTLGLNTWWVGGTYDRRHAAERAGESKVIGVIAVGYGATQGKPHKSKRPDEVSFFDAPDGETPAWFRDGVAAALLAPTAMNRQGFLLSGHDDTAALTCHNGVFTGVDQGIVRYHFELGAGRDRFHWETI